MMSCFPLAGLDNGTDSSVTVTSREEANAPVARYWLRLVLDDDGSQD